MENCNVQNLNPPQGSLNTLPYTSSLAYPLTPSTVTLEGGNPQLQNLLSQNYLPPPTLDQLPQTTHHEVLGTICPHQDTWWPVSASGPQIGQIAEACSSDGSIFGGTLRRFAEEQIRAYSSGPDWQHTDRGVSLQPTGIHSFGQADSPFADRSDDQKLEHVTGNHPLSHFQHKPASTSTRPVPKTKRARRPKRVGETLKEWLCHHDNCKKEYWRRQELIRHIRDKHSVQRMCPFSGCDIKWTRAEKIRAHLTTCHKNHFNEEELQEIEALWGLEDTIWFLTK